MDPYSDIELIERFLAKELTPEEVEMVTLRLKTDKEFSELLALQRDMEATIGDPGLIQLTDTLQSIDEERFGSGTAGSGNSFQWWKYAVAASLIGILVVVGWRVLLPSSQDSLFEQYFQPYDTKEIPRGVDSAAKGTFEKGVSLYEAGKYDAAFAEFSLVNQDSIYGPSANFLMGNCKLSTGKPSESIPIFSRLLEKRDHLFRQASQWYLALAYIETNQNAQAIPLLEELSKKGKYRESAQELLDRL